MLNDFPEDTFTEQEVLNRLEKAGKKYQNGSRYILAQCPLPEHQDKNPSAQIYKDDWFVNCHVCGRFHIAKAFPELREGLRNEGKTNGMERRQDRISSAVPTVMTEHEYKTYNLMDYWRELPGIPGSFVLHGIPGNFLSEMGWRSDGEKGIFIPYFSRSKDSIPFVQWRHLAGERRFTFLKDAKPTCYGTWNLDPGETIFIVEGCSDAAVLEYCGVPWCAMPSASSGALLGRMAAFCSNNGIRLVYAGDNDSAGSKLLEALEKNAPYRLKQPPKQYKDWGEFLETTDVKVVQSYCFEELYHRKPAYAEAPKVSEKVIAQAEVNKVLSLFPE